MVKGGKVTNRVTLNRVAKQTKRDPVKLYRLPEIRPECLYLIRYFCEVKGQEPLTFCEVEAWTRLTGNAVSPAEVKILFILDSLFYESKVENE